MSSEQLRSKLWGIANQIRGRMDASEFKNYMLGFIFFKFLSDKIIEAFNKQFIADLNGQSIDEFLKYKSDKDKKEIEKLISNAIGYYFPLEYSFNNIIKKINQGKEILEDLKQAFNYIENSTIGKKSNDDFVGLFDDIDLGNNKLGSNFAERDRFIGKILTKINDIKFSKKADSLGDAYEYLIANFASDAGKKGGEFYTPPQVSNILAKITTLNKERIDKAYDPTCGSGSLLLKVYNSLNIRHIYGQELNHTTFNLARMNMFLHGAAYDKFTIKQGDTLENDKFYGEKFNVIVANPPFGSKWSRADKFLSDERFSEYGELPPKNNADYSFIMHMLNHLVEDGVMATVFSNSVLSRGNSEARLREKIINNKNYLDAVIGLPANLFFGTTIPAIIMVFKKRRENKDILFIDASQEFEKEKNQNKLTDEHINKIVDTFANRKEIDKYSKKVSLQEIKDNEYNLNISIYVDTFEEESEIDLKEITNNLEKISKDKNKIKSSLNKMLDELNLKNI